MEKMLDLLERWNQEPAQLVPVGRIKTDPALQPRVEKVVPFKHRSRQDAEREEHLRRLRNVLDGGVTVELDPVLVADWGEGLYLVDGHHRLWAYRNCSRPQIPARILRVSKADAVMVSKLVNNRGVKLALHKEQAREACWQFIVGSYLRDMPVPSNRKLASEFGIDKDTVAAMKRRRERVNLQDYNPDFGDEATGWPRWRDVRGNAWKGGLEALDQDARLEWRAEKVAKKLMGIVADTPQDVLERAFEILKQEEQQEELEKRRAALDWEMFLRHLDDEDAA